MQCSYSITMPPPAMSKRRSSRLRIASSPRTTSGYPR